MKELDKVIKYTLRLERKQQKDLERLIRKGQEKGELIDTHMRKGY